MTVCSFLKAIVDQAETVKRVLTVFPRCTEQLLSESKCSIFFNEKCPEVIREGIKETLGAVSSSFESKYLGLSMPEGRMKDEHFQPIMDVFGKG